MSLLVFDHLYVVCPLFYLVLCRWPCRLSEFHPNRASPISKAYRPFRKQSCLNTISRFDTSLFIWGVNGSTYLVYRTKIFAPNVFLNHLQTIQNVCAISLLDFVSKRPVSYQRGQKVLRTMLDITVVFQSGQHCNKTDTPATQIVLISFGCRNTSYNILPP